MNPLPEHLASASFADRLLARLGFVRYHRYTDRLAKCDGYEVRIDTLEAALAAQRERLAAAHEELDSLAHKLSSANRIVGEQIDKLTALDDELTDARCELAAAEHERDELAKTPPPVRFTERHAALLRDRADSQRDLLEAVGALASDAALMLSSQAVAPGGTEADRLHTAGGAYHLAAWRTQLDHASRPRNA